MADKAPDATDVATAPVEPEKSYKVAIFQFNRADGASVWHDEIHPASAFGDELDLLLQLGALVPAE